MTAVLDIGDDDPVTLDDACELFFRGRLTKSSLRTEARRGNLELIRIANKDFVTHNGVKRMIEKCRKNESRQGYISEKTGIETSGSSGTEQPMSAQDALRIKLKTQAKSSKNTSQKNMSPSAEVVRLR